MILGVLPVWPTSSKCTQDEPYAPIFHAQALLYLATYIMVIIMWRKSKRIGKVVADVENVEQSSVLSASRQVNTDTKVEQKENDGVQVEMSDRRAVTNNGATQ